MEDYKVSPAASTSQHLDLAALEEASFSDNAAVTLDAKATRRNKTGKRNPRASWSCVACTRRKIKCDKVVPCTACTKRGQASGCHLAAEDPQAAVRRDPLEGGGPAAPSVDTARPATSAELHTIKESVVGIRQRLWHVESLLARFTPKEPEGGGEEDAWIMEPSQNDGVRSSDGFEEGGRLTVKRRRVDREGFGAEDDDRAGGSGGTTGTAAGGQAESDEEVEAAVRLEYVALGRDRKDDHLGRSFVRRADAATVPQQPDVASWQSALSRSAVGDDVVNSQTSPIIAQHRPLNVSPSLTQPTPLPRPNDAPAADAYPSKVLSDAIVRFSLERVAWHYGCVHAGTFRAECEEFWQMGDARGSVANSAWMAFYYAVLCAGVQHMSKTAAERCGLTEDDLRILPKHFFDASVDSLYRGSFLAQHSVLAVQAIVVLVVTCQSLGPSDFVATLLSVGIRTAQHLNLHRLGTDEAWQRKRAKLGVDPFSEEGIKGLVDREVRKRIWCALTTEDWVSVPFRHSYAIFPDHVTTSLPLNIHDEDLSRGSSIARPADEPTIVSKILLSLQLASCVRRLFDSIAKAGDHSYDALLRIDAEVRELMQSAPAYLDPLADISHLPPFVEWHRYLWGFQGPYSVVVYHRPFLGRAYKDPRFAYSRKAATDASRAILAQLARGSGRDQPHLWSVPYQAISAATCLLLDVFQSSTATAEAHDTTAKRKEVRQAVEHLRLLAETSPIAARGVQLLDSLLAEERKRNLPVQHQQQRALAAVSHVRSEPNAGGGFRDVAHRASLALSDPTQSLSPSTASQPSPIAPAAPPITVGAFHPSPDTSAFETLGADSSFTQSMLDQMLMGAPLGGEEGLTYSGVDQGGAFWDLMEGGFGAGVGEEGVEWGAY